MTYVMQNHHPVDDHIMRNRVAWDKFARDYVEPGRQAWAQSEPTWGIWGIPESEAKLLPDVKGLDIIELGCGTAYVSAWLARRGANVVIGIDNSIEQLRTARELQKEHNLSFPLIHGNAEEVPLPDSSFDLAISEYGAAIWCDPYRWIPEASRLLRRGGRLIFLGNGVILMLCLPDSGGGDEEPATSQLVRDYFGMHRFEFASEGNYGEVEFHLGYGDWIRLLRANGFEIEDLKELRPREGSTTRYPFVGIDWARRWPSEEAWISRKI
jgi:SAM-dependent methyltransferase